MSLTGFVGGLGCTIVVWYVHSLLLRATAPAPSSRLPTVLGALALAVPFLAVGALAVLRARGAVRARWAAFGLGVSSPYLLFAGLAFAPKVVAYVRRTDFDAARWRASTGERTEERQRMVDDLVDSGRLRGLTTQEVAALLGPPDGSRSPGEWSYDMGLPPGFMELELDLAFLVIRFDAEGRVSSVFTCTG